MRATCPSITYAIPISMAVQLSPQSLTPNPTANQFYTHYHSVPTSQQTHSLSMTKTKSLTLFVVTTMCHALRLRGMCWRNWCPQSARLVTQCQQPHCTSPRPPACPSDEGQAGCCCLVKTLPAGPLNTHSAGLINLLCAAGSIEIGTQNEEWTSALTYNYSIIIIIIIISIIIIFHLYILRACKYFASLLT